MSENPISPFFKLPLELRIIIYRMVLVVDTERVISLLECMCSGPRSGPDVQAALLRVNRQIYTEALSILYRSYKVVVNLYALFDTLDKTFFVRTASTFFISTNETVSGRTEHPLAQLQTPPALGNAKPQSSFYDNVFMRFADIEIGMFFYGHIDNVIGYIDIDVPKMAGLATLIDILSKGEEGPFDSDGLPLKSLVLDLNYNLENWTDEEVHKNPVKTKKFKRHFMVVLDGFGGLTALKTLQKIRRVTITGDFEEKDFEIPGALTNKG